MSKCLVTGLAGFVGSHVAEALIEAGHEVHGIDNLSTGKEENIPTRAKYEIGTINGTILQEYEVDYIFHLAALARIQPSIEDPRTTHVTNVNGTLEVLELARSCGAKVIFSSSSSVYDSDLPSKEDSKTHPKNPYSLQKLVSEQYIKLYNELYNVDYCILRYFNVFGERQILDGAYAAVVGIFLDQYKSNEFLTITNDGEQRRDFTYVKDVARANVMAMDWSGTFNIGSGENISINELARVFSNKTKYLGERKGEVRETLADNSKAKKMGWQPIVNIKDWANAAIKDLN